MQRLKGNAGVVAASSSIRARKVPQSPKKLSGGKPAITARIVPLGDAPGNKGAKVMVSFEIQVWGYDGEGNSMYPDCIRACQRITEALKGDRLKTDSGWTTIIMSDGFADVDQPDPNTIMLRAIYTMGYWSSQNIAAIRGA